MEILRENLIKNEDLEKKIRIVCSYNNSKMNVIDGQIINVDGTNISFIEPHKIIITIKRYKLLVIYYDRDNIFLYNRRIPLTLRKLEALLKHILKEVR